MLQKLASFAGINGPVVTIVMDGYGISKSDVGSAITAARKPTLDRLFANYPNITLRAHGTAVETVTFAVFDDVNAEAYGRLLA